MTGIALLAVVVVAAAQEPVRVDYDTFMQGDFQSRIRVFNMVSPENRAELVRVQIERWLAKHRARLTTEQVAVMEENLAFVTPAIYQQPKRPGDVECRRTSSVAPQRYSRPRTCGRR